MKKLIVLAVLAVFAVAAATAFAGGMPSSSDKASGETRESGFQKLYDDLNGAPASMNPDETATKGDRGDAGKVHKKLYKLGQRYPGDMI